MTPPPQPTATYHDQFSDTISINSAASSPRSSNHNYHTDPRLRLMCSFGGKIVPRPHDNQLRYVGGDTRIIAISRHTTFAALLTKLSKTVGTVVSYNNLTVKYQLPNEDLDALISVSNDEDVENMMDEYDRVGSKEGRLRLFLFNDISRTTSSMSSILNGSMRRESWFLDALNGGGGSTGGGGPLERGLSEASSIVSEVPDYLFGLDTSDEVPKIRTRSNLADCISSSDPGSPAPVISSTSPSPNFPISSSAATAVIAPQMITNLLPVKNIVETVPVSVPLQPGLVQSNPLWQYNPDPYNSGQIQRVNSFQPMPVYYIPDPIRPGNYPVQPGPMPAQFVQVQPSGIGQQQQVPVGYYPAGLSQIHGVPPNGGMLRPMGVGLDSYDGVSHPAPGYYGQQVHAYPAGGAEEQRVSAADAMGNGGGK